MANATTPAAAEQEIAASLDIPADRRVLAKAYAALLAKTAGKVALELPINADVDDFRRVLIREARP